MSARQIQFLIQKLKERNWKIRCVESCTAGALTAEIASVGGASDVLDRSWVTYSNQAKHEEVGVPLNLIETYGAVSEQVVTAMAAGAVKGCEDFTASISVSGIAGPGGGTADKPVGTVWIALKLPKHSVKTKCYLFDGDRADIQQQAIEKALSMLVSHLAS